MKFSTPLDNIVELPYNDIERVVGFMRTRFYNGQIYTWAGNVLLCVQTYQDSKPSKEQYYATTSLEEQVYKAPSIQTVVNRLWFRLRHGIGRKDQAMVVSGESGSGKTYSTCLTIKSIANKEDMDMEGHSILWQVWASVPLLSAFGNASTALNTNSSRFGKLLRLQYINGRLRGAMLETYLIEKSRVANITPGEGNFHIFRQIIDSLDSETLKSLKLSKNISYRIAPKIGLKSAYAETIKSLEILNISELDQILIILAIILNLGNVTFVENANSCHGDGCDDSFTVNPDCREYLENVCGLLRVSCDSVVDLLCTQQFTTNCLKQRETIYKSPCANIQECEARRDCIMKHLYERLFCWLVNAINFRIFLGHAEEYINILDLYGFEIFDHNSFEQLCINYANERLQQYFFMGFLDSERTDLINDGFEVEQMNGSEYLERISLLDGPLSIFGILNEECAMKRFKNDLYINTRLGQALRGKKHFFINDELETYFSIRHFAGVVKYDTASMVSKNRDKVPNDIITFLRRCDFSFLKVLLENEEEIATNKRTVLTYFKRSFDELITIFDKCDVHYVKCLKPNGFKMAEFFDEDYFTDQMRTNGIFEILKLSFQNYSLRLSLDHFVNHIGFDLLHILKKPLSDQLHIGRNKIYMTETCYAVFDRFLQIRLSQAARTIQKCWLKYMSRRYQAACIIQLFVRRHLLLKHHSSCGEFLDISKRSSCPDHMPVWSSSEISKLNNIQLKIEQYLEKNNVEINFEGAPLSLQLERIYNQLETKKFKRVLFCGDRFISYHKLAEIPVHFHVRRTCMRYSHLLPKSEMPRGLEDIF